MFPLLPLHQSKSFLFTDRDQVGEVRRWALMLAENMELDETQGGRVGIVATELANNLVKHAGGGEMLVRAVVCNAMKGVEIISLDKGPGMDINRCLEDGYSTAGSPGTGLGAISRMASDFHVYSQAEKGSVITASLWQNPAKRQQDDIECGAICRPLEHEKECGDGWDIQREGKKLRVLMVDGLGHGETAARASHAAIEAFQGSFAHSLTQLAQMLHGALLSTRGAAAAIAEIDFEQKKLVFLGVGNIAGTIVQDGKPRGLASYNGTMGHRMHKVKEFIYPFTTDALVTFHTDGLSQKWKLDDYPGLVNRHPCLINGVLYRDYQRVRDDATTLTLRGS